jgi:hypothetical protein
VELRTDDAEDRWRLAAEPGQRAMLVAGSQEVPVSIRAISASSREDEEACRLLGPGYVLDDDAEAWVAVMETYGGELRVASSFLTLSEVRRLLRRGLDDVGSAGGSSRTTSDPGSAPRPVPDLQRGGMEACPVGGRDHPEARSRLLRQGTIRNEPEGRTARATALLRQRDAGRWSLDQRAGRVPRAPRCCIHLARVLAHDARLARPGPAGLRCPDVPAARRG